MADQPVSFSLLDNRLIRYGQDLLRRYDRVLRFLLVGALNTAVGYGLFAVIFLTTGRHRIAIVLATILGVLFNFFTLGHMVFGNLTARTLLPFVLGYVVTLSVNIVVIEVLLHLGIHALIAQALMLPFIALMVYSINSKLVFRT